MSVFMCHWRQNWKYLAVRAIGGQVISLLAPHSIRRSEGLMLTLFFLFSFVFLFLFIYFFILGNLTQHI